MKKIAGKIAMILILVMLANSFAGCMIWGPIVMGGSTDDKILAFLAGLVVDIFTIVVIVYCLGGFGEAPNETGIYLAGAEHNPLMDYYSVMEKLNSGTISSRIPRL
jgi:hypothetical protein